jgi:hypothetical protein
LDTPSRTGLFEIVILTVKFPLRCRWCHVTGAQQNNIRSHASTAHREEFLLAQHRKEKVNSMIRGTMLKNIIID